MYTTDKAKNELNKVVDLFSSESLPEVCARVMINAPEIPSSKWSLSNRIIMALNGTTDARGFKQWKEVSRSVKGGSKAFYILAPMVRKYEKKNEETGEKEEKRYVTGFRAVPVFRLEDTQGKALPEYKPKNLPPLLDVAKAWGVKVTYAVQAGAYGSFNPSKDEITLGTEDADVFFHELGHKAHSKIEKLKGGQHPEQEAIAELTACVLARMYGFNVDNRSFNYLGFYSEDKSPEAVGKLCLRVLSKVEKVLKLILEEDAKINGGENSK